MSTHRGNLIVKRRGVWLYQADSVLVSDDPDRDCGHCGRTNTAAGHDGCLGELRHVRNACCGHGTIADAYIQLPGGDVLRGQDALTFVADQRALEREQAQ